MEIVVRIETVKRRILPKIKGSTIKNENSAAIILFIPNNRPFDVPWVFKLSIKYSEQVGKNLQFWPNNGEKKLTDKNFIQRKKLNCLVFELLWFILNIKIFKRKT